MRNFKEFIKLSTLKTGIYLRRKQLKEVVSKTARLENEYEKQQATLVEEIAEIPLTYTPVMEKLSLTFANLDVLNSFAHVSLYAPIQYVRSKMYGFDGEGRKTKLIAFRHPVVEIQNDRIYIAIDVNIETKVNEFLIIACLNMGGRSTYIT